MGESIIQRSFAAGELAPALHARADQVKYQQGLRTCDNFFVRREGGVSNRAGFRFVEPCKTNTYGTRLMRFVGAEPGTSFLIEMGAGYFRFFQNGALLEVSSAPAWSALTDYFPGDIVDSGGTFYYATAASTNVVPPNAAFWYAQPGGVLEVPTPYTLATLPAWNQSGNVLTLTHSLLVPHELVYLGSARWLLREVDTASAFPTPQNVAGVAAGAGARTFAYLVTAAGATTFEESDPSAVATVAATIEPTVDAPIALTWDTDPDVEEWYVYCDPYQNGVFGYIGTAAVNSFNHSGETPDFNLGPPTSRILFDAAGKYPAVASQYQQRRFFAGSVDEPDAFWGSRIGFPHNFGVSSPLQDDDSVTFRLAGNNHHPIRHMVAIKAGLILLTDGGEWTVTGGGGPKTPITPGSIDATQETYVGIAKDIRPVVVGNAILYVQARGGTLREILFDQQVEGLAGRDLTIFATHLFDRRTFRGIDYQQFPHSIIWCVRDDGRLLGLTYISDQDVWGWHRQTSQGVFEAVCVVPELEEDVLYVVVRRTIGGVNVRYIERLERRELLEGSIHATSFFVDSGLSYSGAPATTFAGLDHLEGREVVALADGVPLGPYTVVAGAVTLPAAYTNVHIGLAYTAELETLDLDVQGSNIRDAKKRIPSVTLLVESSARLFQAGPDAVNLRTYNPDPWEPVADVHTDPLELVMTGRYDRVGRVLVRQTNPVPLTILGVVPHVEPGG